MGDCGYSAIDTRRNKSLPNFWSLRIAHRDQCCTHAFTSHPRNDKFAAHIEFVGRDEFEILWFPAQARIRTLCEDVVVAIRRPYV